MQRGHLRLAAALRCACGDGRLMAGPRPARMRHSRPDSFLGVQVEVLQSSVRHGYCVMIGYCELLCTNGLLDRSVGDRRLMAGIDNLLLHSTFVYSGFST